jgi:hypothetical protein
VIWSERKTYLIFIFFIECPGLEPGSRAERRAFQLFNGISVNIDEVEVLENNLRLTRGIMVRATSAKEYSNMISTPGHSSQYLGEGCSAYNAGSLKDIEK